MQPSTPMMSSLLCFFIASEVFQSFSYALFGIVANGAGIEKNDIGIEFVVG